MKRRITLSFFISCLLIYPLALLAQDIPVTGTVTSKTDGGPMPGVTVVVQGTNRGTTTSGSGEFRINAPIGSKLTFSLIGMQSQTVSVTSEAPISVSLADDVSALEEVVVVGYGTQKKSVVTGAISSVKAADLEALPLNRIEQSLQGRTSGVSIAASSGQPGSGSTVRVRGITSLGSSDPLWVVDGVVVDNGGIGYLNQSDIESIEVLKDAASQAIYGTRAAAGVILVTTKKGKEGGIRINYNGFYGTSAPARKLSLLNATEYATLQNEVLASDGATTLKFPDPESLGEGTDWQSAIFNNSAGRHNHEFSISGGNEKSTFYTSFGYLDQEGIVASEISKYKRVNIRLNSVHKVAKWLTLGQNLGYARDKSSGLGNTNSEFGGPLSSAINLDPTLPLLVTDPALASSTLYNNVGVIRNQFGYPYGIANQQELTNPVSYIQTRLGNYGWSDNVIGNAYAEVQPIEGLKFRSTLGVKLSYWGSESFTPIFFLSPSPGGANTRTSFNRGINNGFNYNIENTVSYTKSIKDHSFEVLLGQGAYLDGRSRSINVTYQDLPVDNFDDASMNYNVPQASRTSGGSEGVDHTISSLFTRLNYNYKEKYLFQGIIRRDGSSRFGSNKMYGVFPSFAAGWVPTLEEFWPKNDIVSFLKLRGGYGVVGSDNIGNFQYISTIGGGRSYTIGTTGIPTIGYSPNAPANPDLAWEETRSTNIGFEATLFNNLTVAFDWFNKKSVGLLQNPRIPTYTGAISPPAVNVGDMANRGVELELGYQRKLGEVDFSANGNISFIKNEVTNLGNVQFLDGGVGFQATSYPITRVAVGQQINAFYGFQTLGVFQNQEEINSHVNSQGAIIQPTAAPGDFRWQDTDDNGIIDEKDRVFLGNPLPKWSFGLTLNAAYKGFDVLVFGQGAGGNKIFQGLRRLDIPTANYQRAALGRWVGEGSTNSHPRLSNGNPTFQRNYTNPSDFYLQDGDYFRLKVVQLGYTLPQSISSKAGMQKARIYVMSENLLTFTKYTGYDPEIGGGVMSIDRGIYPQARSFMVGLQVGF